MVRALENTESGEDRFHGRSGPLPIHQRTYDELTPSVKAFIHAAEQQGYRYIDDPNADQRSGVAAIDLNLLATPRDRSRMLEGLKLSRGIGLGKTFAAVAESEMMPGDQIHDDAGLERAIDQQVASFQHATSTAPMDASARQRLLGRKWRVRDGRAVERMDSDPDVRPGGGGA